MRLRSVMGSLLFVSAVGGCAGEQLELTGAQPVAAPVNADMSGRWILTAPNAPSCGMMFGGAAGALEGTVVPEGGCPGGFFTSRSWRTSAETLVINDHEKKPLGELKRTGDRFSGKAADGTPLTLTRSNPL